MQRGTLPVDWLKFIIPLLLILGIFFRFVDLDQNLYSIDEVRSFLRLSGYTAREFVEQVLNGDVITVEEFQTYQRPNLEKNLLDAINALAGNPEHPPLYYLMARFCVQWFGAPVAARYLTAFISLLAFPCLYWLCLELFQSSLTGWIAIALIAISPLHVLLAQKARQYSLLEVIILLSSASLLYALRLATRRSWIIYAVTLVLGFYTHLFFGLVVISHGIYVVVTRGLQFSKALVNYLLAFLVGLLAFVPWLWVIITRLDQLNQKTTWVRNYRTSLPNIVKIWLHNLSIAFFDFNLPASFKNPIPYFVLILIAYSIYFLCRQKSKQVWLFILMLIGVTALAHGLSDIIFGGRRSLLPRYLIPCYLGIQLAVSYLFATQLTTFSVNLWRQRLWKLVLAILLSGGIVSCVLISQAQGWNDDQASLTNLEVAPIINKTNHPLVISDAHYIYIFPLSYLLDSKVNLQLFTYKKPNYIESKLNVLGTIDHFKEVFIYLPSKNLLDIFEKNYNFNLKLIVKGSKGKKWLYKLVK